MEGPRPPFENEYSKVIDFVSSSLRPNTHWNISEEYPTAFTLANLNNIRVMFDEEAVVSHALIKPLIVKTPLLLLKVAAIGSVVTASSHRNQGLSRQIMEDCLKSAEAQGCDIALLWTDIPDFYRKFDFEMAGTENHFTITGELPTESNNLKFVTGPKVAPEAILNLYQKHSVTTLRTAEEIRRFLKIPNSNIYTAWNTSNQLMAYAVEGKGADLKGHIHEWGGNVPELFALLNFIRAQTKQNLKIISPAHSLNLGKKLEAAGAIKHDNFLGMIRILRPDLLCSKIKKASRDLGIDDLIFERQGGQFYIGRPGHVFKTDSVVDLTKLIFGPWRPADIHNFDAQSLAILNKIFPIQMWMWGWDSI
ncbi:MAG: hypothetical protein RJB66_332 [Pseudomonadota bacterium]|jgi:GNAT superfamily N-acetyltransferase